MLFQPIFTKVLCGKTMRFTMASSPDVKMNEQELTKLFEGITSLGFKLVLFPEHPESFYVQTNLMTMFFRDLIKRCFGSWDMHRHGWAINRSMAKEFYETAEIDCSIMQNPPLDRSEIRALLLSIFREHHIKFEDHDDDDTGEDYYLFFDVTDDFWVIRKYGLRVQQNSEDWAVPKLRDFHLLLGLRACIDAKNKFNNRALKSCGSPTTNDDPKIDQQF